jgi:hydroxymethylbilane synthase
MLVVAMANDEYSRQALHELNDIDTEICTHIERQFLKTLETFWHHWCFSRFVADDIVFKAFCFLLMVKKNRN